MESTDNEMVLIDEETIRNRIYVIRDQKIMLDFDLAKIFGYDTKILNRQVKRNIDRFPLDFRFQLTQEEVDGLRCQNGTANISPKARTRPIAFIEQGIYMLMTVLNGDLAVKQSMELIRVFKSMKDYLVENHDLVDPKDLIKLFLQTSNNTNSIEEIKKLMVTKEELKKVMDNFIDPTNYKHFLIMNGQKIEADIAYTRIYESAKHTIFIVDNYLGLKTLELLRATRINVQIVIFSDNLKK